MEKSLPKKAELMQKKEQIFKLNIINIFNKQGKTLKHKTREILMNTCRYQGEKSKMWKLKKKKEQWMG